MQSGSIALVLNAHLPFVRQPDYPQFLEERWLFESLSECYLPLLRLFARLEADSVPWRLSLALSPTLTTMLADTLLQNRYIAWLGKQLELADKELERLADDQEQLPLAILYADLYRQNLEDFTVLHGRNILNAFDFYYKKGRLDLLTSAATHAFLPLYQSLPQAIAAQIEAGVVAFRSSFGRAPNGFWLPQLGWFPGLQDVLSAYGLQYTVITTRSAMLGRPAPRFGSYAPVVCENGLTAFIRDIESTDAVWSEDDGYPSDPVYREFYRDIGFDLPLDYIGPFIDLKQVRTFTGFKYWAVTGHTETKQLYKPERAALKVIEHAENFLYSRTRQLRKASALMRKPALLVAPFDAELFGHWWYEGIDWLEAIFRSAQATSELSFVTLSEAWRNKADCVRTTPEYASWGDDGYAGVWLNKSNDWLYRHTYKLVERMTELANRFPDEGGLRERVLNQAAREVMLAQSADWPFLLRAGKSSSFARKQIEDAVTNFGRIYEMMCANTVGTEWVTRLEKRNKIFPAMNYRVFRTKQ
ncbi:MAG: glycoside hydrolase [Spirochaetes bacterium GWD1_61_31]|nr:MAG: glycoside hydrolase [Spirochaetes bacterium GWB1_60_80]OHD30113.1 MAG: glycoside hydrolase [Spirochaetes bacterium GWC1_61_12]OHD34634.1 MAG: glycoside hydrolase [Spirochaetes bacterium GWD1_61_31]OHD46450.1 MAG: glycoside hydrolase [Spirochaetes bacterium GWE1_60_18]OHD59505.1 MAG: glycoside hydrolase [Spirochaetes bacterium GWF1_60_12]HAW85798.1 DUF1957 domain-containing protein [Spirochaetaceae bacterium]